MLRSGHGRSRRARAGVLGSALLAGADLAGCRAGKGARRAPPPPASRPRGPPPAPSPTPALRPAGPYRPASPASLTVVADGGAGGAARDVLNSGAEYVYPPGGPGGEYTATLTSIPARHDPQHLPRRLRRPRQRWGGGKRRLGRRSLIPEFNPAGAGGPARSRSRRSRWRACWSSPAAAAVPPTTAVSPATTAIPCLTWSAGPAAAAATSTAAGGRPAAAQAAGAAAVPPPRAASAAPNPAVFTQRAGGQLQGGNSGGSGSTRAIWVTATAAAGAAAATSAAAAGEPAAAEAVPGSRRPRRWPMASPSRRTPPTPAPTPATAW